MSFIPAPSRAAVEGPSPDRDQVWVASLHSEDRGHHPLSAQATSSQRIRSNIISRRFPRSLDRRLGPSTAARVTLLPKEIFRLASAQDDRIFKTRIKR